MTKIYLPVSKSFFTLVVILALTVICIHSSPADAQENSVFIIRDIKVDVTADSAAKARDKAFNQAMNTAFKRLSRRILRFEDASVLPIPDKPNLQRLVKDFEIRNEKLSSVRYKANYVFRFKQNAVREYFDSLGLSYTDVGSKPVLILPFYQTARQTLLWDNANPWQKAWSRAEGNQGLVPVAVPLGDLKDVSFISDNEALNYDPRKLEEMAARYNAGSAIILIAAQPVQNISDLAPEQPAQKPLTIFIYRTDSIKPEFVKKIALFPKNNETRKSLFDRAVARVFSLLQMNWKKQTVVDPDANNQLLVNIRYDSLDDWVKIKNTLARVQGLLAVEYRSISINQAKIKLFFKGSEQRLRLALAQANMQLSKPQVNIASLLEDTESKNAPLTYKLKYTP